jgi:CTP:molybdopterin cytidylyltransferase MocA
MSDGGVSGLVLAAGVGRRIGRAKLRLTEGNASFLHRCVHALSGADVADVLCVVSPEEAGWAAAEVPTARVVLNATGSSAMISSVRIGVAALQSRQAIVILPVDHPDVASGTIRLILAAAAGHPGVVVKPVYRGRAGHPVLVPNAVFAPILASRDDDTLREILASAGGAALRVEVDDPGVLRNVNAPGDLESQHSMEE